MLVGWFGAHPLMRLCAAHTPAAHSSILAVTFCTASGSCLVTPLATSRSSRRGLLACRRERALESAPTGSWFLLLYWVGSETCAAIRRWESHVCVCVSVVFMR